MITDTNSFNNFNEVKHQPLRAFNRVIMLRNLHESKGKFTAEQYIGIFSDKERAEMYLVGMAIKNSNIEEVQKVVTKDLNITYNPADSLS